MHRPHWFFIRMPLCAALIAPLAMAVEDPPRPAPSLTLAAALRGAPATLHFQGGVPYGAAWLTLDDGLHAGSSPGSSLGSPLGSPQGSPQGFAGGFVRPAGRPLARYDLDATGGFQVELGPNAFRTAASISVFAVPPDGAWSRGVRPRSLSLPLASSGAALLDQQTGELVLTEFMKDPVGVSDARGEWVEFFNASGVVLDIEGWVLSDEGSDRVVLDNGGQGMFVVPSTYVVLGRESDPALNGGVGVDFVYAGMTLSNGADEIVLSRPNGAVIDRVRYDDGVDWPDVPGHAIFLAPLAVNEYRNDGGARWCDSLMPLVPGGSDTGTPGATNETRPGC